MKLLPFLQRISWQTWIVIACIVVGGFLRLWNFDNTLQFLGDQGRDATIAKRILKDADPVLIGPVTSTGNMYLGPFYYYFMVPFLWLTYPSPLGPAYAIALFSIISIGLLYYLGKELVGPRAAAIGTALFSLSVVAVTYSRFSWNPNLAPFVSIILLWASYRALRRSPLYFIVISVCIALLIQMHYVTLLTIPAAGVLWLLVLKRTFFKKSSKKSSHKQHFLLATGVAVVIMLGSFIPQAFFDYRHPEYSHAESLEKLLFQDGSGFGPTSTPARALRVIKETHGRSLQILSEMYVGRANRDMNTVITVITLAILLFVTRKYWNTAQGDGYLVLLVYLLFAVAGLSFYRSTVFNHYIAYLFPVTMLIYGLAIDKLWRWKVGKVLTLLFLFLFLSWNLLNYPLQSLSWTVSDIQRGAQTIRERVQPGEKYDIVLLTGTGDIEGLNYRYFLETTDHPPVSQEQQGETETLFIINEDKKLKRVVDSPIWQIVTFPNHNPSEVYTVPENGPEITVLKRIK